MLKTPLCRLTSRPFAINHIPQALDGEAFRYTLEAKPAVKAAALHIMLDAIAVFVRSELRKRAFPRIQSIALLLYLDLIGARLVGDLEQLLEQGALFSRARTCRKSPRIRTMHSMSSRSHDCWRQPAPWV
jgi:hypothetical protein